jgi:hypothetical protein
MAAAVGEASPRTVQAIGRATSLEAEGDGVVATPGLHREERARRDGFRIEAVDAAQPIAPPLFAN